MYAFFLDIDGTIYSGKPVSAAVIDAITRARAAGHKVFINTSRAYIGMPEQIYGLPFDGFVTSFGLEIMADGKWIHRHFLPDEHVQKVAKYAFDNALKVYFEGEIRIDIHNSNGFGLHPQDLQELWEMMGKKHVSKFVLSGPPTAEEDALFAGDYDFFGGEGIAKGHNKAYGIEILEKRYGIPHENTVAIGDSFLDADMIAYAGIGICMGNGTPDLKATSRYITGSLADDGVAFAIDCVLSGDLSAIRKAD